MEADKKIARYDPATDKIDWQFETGQATTHMVLPARDAPHVLHVQHRIRQCLGDRTGRGRHLDADGRAGRQGAGRAGPLARRPHAVERPFGRRRRLDRRRRLEEGHCHLNVGTKALNRIKLTPDGKFALISDLDAGDLVVLDVATRKEIKRLALGKMPEGILIPPGGARAFVAVNGDNHVAVVDLETWQVTKKIATGVGPDGDGVGPVRIADLGLRIADFIADCGLRIQMKRLPITLTLILACAAGCAPAPQHDVVIRHGTVYDGTGAAAKVEDLAHRRRSRRGARRSERRQRAAGDRRDGPRRRPGFINMLSHSETSLIADGRSQGDIRQGVTLEVFGESSMGPITEQMKIEQTERQGDIKFDITWTTLGEYLDDLVTRGISTERRRRSSAPRPSAPTRSAW